MAVANGDGSIRSLTSLKLVQPPNAARCRSPSPSSPFFERTDDELDDISEIWDPFPAPYAPHAPRHPQDAARGKRGSTPPLSEIACYSYEGRNCLGSPRNRSRGYSRTPEDKKRRAEKLIKINANGSVEGVSNPRGSGDMPRTRSDRDHAVTQLPTPTDAAGPTPGDRSSKKNHRKFPPMLTRGLVHQLKNQHQNDENTNALNKEKGRGVKSSGLSSPKISNDPCIPRIPSAESSSNYNTFLVGTSKVYSRTLIPPTVYHNPVTENWIVTINSSSKLANTTTNSSTQSASDLVKAFSFRTEKEARASAYANAPPVMIPFDSCRECMLCDTKFTLFKRPKHCRNCGICICSNDSCSTVWSKKMIPETFNFKKERKTVKVCTSCHSLAKRFQHALLNGQYGTAVELYLTGNVNLRTPFVFKGRSNKESMLPIHCAIEGRSEKLLRWLVDVQHCPIYILSTGNAGKGTGVMGAGARVMKSLNVTLGVTGSEKKCAFVPTLKTSEGRSVLDIAMKTRHVGMIRYLIQEKHVSVYEVEDLGLALAAVEALAKAFPAVDGSYNPDMFTEKDKVESGLSDKENGGGVISGNPEEKRKGSHARGGSKSAANNSTTALKNAKPKQRIDAGGASPEKARIYSHSVVPLPREKILIPRDIHGINNGYGAYRGYGDNSDDSDSDAEEEEGPGVMVSEDDQSVSTTAPEICVLCREKDVDCVATPCGHQVCCLACSNKRRRCPICNVECHFIRTYNP